MELAAGYLITFTTYGERLHGDARGSVERVRHLGRPVALEPDARRVARAAVRLLGGRQVLDGSQRPVVAEAIRAVCEVRGWTLHAVNVRTNHVHVVVSADEEPEKVMTLFKIWATRLAASVRVDCLRRGRSSGRGTAVQGFFGMSSM